ncbi:MAG: adenylyl-sulfate kinase [Phenylobacterium sp.]|uniref:adenylyl-sulfate kinase n=1 Tax=Phenylobacterium sp. TaxID=1871053 RepID=UPI002736D2FA|nr:adenylyl-sulfate kinase [Phenylobacterium sp.]MDP3749273.1 adenylyl-sulfate kinase [Phenylobacterium sp.]
MDHRDALGRDAHPGSPGTAYWVTGLPGVGKKTLAQTLASRITASGRPVIRLDGDRLREVLGGRFGYGQADRHTVAQVYARLCRELTAQGPDVILATVSMFHDVRRWSRANIERYCEIYLRASVDMLAARHPKGLYAAALAGRIRNVPGVDLPIEEPDTPDIVIDDDGSKTPAAVALELFRRLRLAEAA